MKLSIRFLQVLVVASILLVGGCKYTITPYGSRDIDGAPGGSSYIACGQVGVEAADVGGTETRPSGFSSVGVFASSTVRIDTCNGTAVSALNYVTVKMFAGMYINGVWTVRDCGTDSDNVGGTPGDPVSATAGFYLHNIPTSQCWGFIGSNYTATSVIYFAASATHTSYIQGDAFVVEDTSGWEVYDPS